MFILTWSLSCIGNAQVTMIRRRERPDQATEPSTVREMMTDFPRNVQLSPRQLENCRRVDGFEKRSIISPPTESEFSLLGIYLIVLENGHHFPINDTSQHQIVKQLTQNVSLDDQPSDVLRIFFLLEG